MTDTALGAIPMAVSDELESPARRALRRLLQRKGAVAGLVVIATFILLALGVDGDGGHARSRGFTRK